MAKFILIVIGVVFVGLLQCFRTFASQIIFFAVLTIMFFSFFCGHVSLRYVWDRILSLNRIAKNTIASEKTEVFHQEDVEVLWSNIFGHNCFEVSVNIFLLRILPLQNFTDPLVKITVHQHLFQLEMLFHALVHQCQCFTFLKSDKLRFAHFSILLGVFGGHTSSLFENITRCFGWCNIIHPLHIATFTKVHKPQPSHLDLQDAHRFREDTCQPFRGASLRFFSWRRFECQAELEQNLIAQGKNRFVVHLSSILPPKLTLSYTTTISSLTMPVSRSSMSQTTASQDMLPVIDVDASRSVCIHRLIERSTNGYIFSSPNYLESGQSIQPTRDHKLCVQIPLAVNSIIELVRNISPYLLPFYDWRIDVHFIVAGMSFYCKLGLLLVCPESYLCIRACHSLDCGSENYGIRPIDVYLDRNADVFAVVIEWYRSGMFFLPAVLSRELILYEIKKYYGLPHAAIQILTKKLKPVTVVSHDKALQPNSDTEDDDIISSAAIPSTPLSNSKHGVVHGSKAVPIPTRQVTASKACTNTPSGSSSANVPASAIIDIKAANGPCVTNGGAVNLSAVSDKLLPTSGVHASLRRTGGATHYATFQDDAFTYECGVADMESQAYYPTKNRFQHVSSVIDDVYLCAASTQPKFSKPCVVTPHIVKVSALTESD